MKCVRPSSELFSKKVEYTIPKSSEMAVHTIDQNHPPVKSTSSITRGTSEEDEDNPRSLQTFNQKWNRLELSQELKTQGRLIPGHHLILNCVQRDMLHRLTIRHINPHQYRATVFIPANGFRIHLRHHPQHFWAT